MPESKIYSAQTVFQGLTKTFHQYLEAQYHIWDEGLIGERRALLEKSGVSYQEPQLEATPFYVTGKPYAVLSIPDVAKDILTIASAQPNTGIFPEPYTHQAAALEEFLGQGKEIIVATGTGSGKTESFLMPILGSLAIESRHRPDSWNKPGVRALLLYPMNALVNDQLGRLRRLFGNGEIAKSLRGGRRGFATFGMYTSRTPYPGLSSPSKDRDRVGKLLEKLYQGLSQDARERLEKEGKWPAKDIEQFVKSSFLTGDEDSELLSRHEMHRRAPDLLVTNYSMLEYMLLRPVEKAICDQTAQWLASDKDNRFIVVLDEAHMYRGSSGAEVAYLLRRLHSRLGIDRERVRYVLTSASLGSTEEAQRQIKLFAANLTGHRAEQKPFTLISGDLEKKSGQRAGTSEEERALSEFNFSSLHRIFESTEQAEASLRDLSRRAGKEISDGPQSEESLRHSAYGWLRAFGPAALAANLITARPHTLGAIAQVVFPGGTNAERALESLLALMSFAREKGTNRVFAPVRSHLFFRGLPGLYACVNPSCPGRRSRSDASKLGRLYSTPQQRCECGSRVYELLTHRDCGAAFIRGFLADEHGDFLWHEKSSGLWSELNLLEGHFLVEVDRKSANTEGSNTWLHIPTGRLVPLPPSKEESRDYLPVVRPDGIISDAGRSVLTFNGECPVCVRRWQGASKIMDLMTKGEAPFAHLIRAQVALQPMTQVATEQSPNGGRKSLLFSDGRQKAARLARDIPREIEQDVFRQLLLLAVSALKKIGHESVLSPRIYLAFLDILNRTGLQLLDGDDRHALQQHVREYRRWHNGDLAEALRDFSASPPAGFTALLLRQLGSRFYSVNALTLGFLTPTAKAQRVITEGYTALRADDSLSLSRVWLQGFANEFAFDPSVKLGIRIKAAGYPVGGLAPIGGFSKRQQKFLIGRLGDIDPLLRSFADALCEKDASGAMFLAPGRVALELALSQRWYQCNSCTAVSPTAWWGHCPNCLTPGVVAVEPGTTSYLRARKGFWRDPVVAALEGRDQPLNLTVEEHTAQLSYRDVDDPAPTTEEFERRFRDILVNDADTSIDVLSSTTTMEVGIDIGSLVAVGLRNVPPLRQNYQQRAGRAGRSGSAISTVITYAQNSPHDNYYFENPKLIIAGEPTLPSVDTGNPKIIERHVRAQLVQAFFHSKGTGSGSADIFSMLGDTWEFYTGEGEFSFKSFSQWLTSEAILASYESIKGWLPDNFKKAPAQIAAEFILGLEKVRPTSQDHLDQADEYLIEFLFSHGFLPSYAFPRDLCALQIEQERVGPGRRVQIVQRPQQGLNIALSEYAPGRFVVVDKKTYRVGSVTAGGTSVVVDRAQRLFTGKRLYVHCSACLFTAGFMHELGEKKLCPLCRFGELNAVTVIQPEIVYPDGGREIDEYDDEQVFSQTTGAQLPLPEGGASFDWQPFLQRGQLAFARNQPLVMVNKGAVSNRGDGFLVCNLCGKTSLDGKPLGSHRRDYRIDPRRGVPAPSHTCSGEFEQVYLGYSFSSDILLFRLPIGKPFRFDPRAKRARQPLADALQSLCEALVIGISRELDIDIREINSGYRFVRHGNDHYADIFVYDTLSGGAGYATEAGEDFKAVFKRVEELLTHCTCPSSCDKCLRHYGNRLHHESLNRFLAGDLAKFVRTGDAPALFEVERQVLELEPIAQLLSLAGWKITRRGKTPVLGTRGSRVIELWSCPSLIDPVDAGFVQAPNAYVFSPYELSRDLPGAYKEVA